MMGIRDFFSEEFFYCCSIYVIVDNYRSFRRILSILRSILLLIRITIRNEEFLTEFLPPRSNGGSCGNFVGFAALAEVRGFRALLALHVMQSIQSVRDRTGSRRPKRESDAERRKNLRVVRRRRVGPSRRRLVSRSSSSSSPGRRCTATASWSCANGSASEWATSPTTWSNCGCSTLRPYITLYTCVCRHYR